MDPTPPRSHSPLFAEQVELTVPLVHVDHGHDLQDARADHDPHLALDALAVADRHPGQADGLVVPVIGTVGRADRLDGCPGRSDRAPVGPAAGPRADPDRLLDLDAGPKLPRPHRYTTR